MAPRQQHSIRRTDGGQIYVVTIPTGVRAGGEFNVQVNGRTVTVTCPHGVSTRPGTQLRIRIPDPSPDLQRSDTSNGTPQQRPTLHQTFEVKHYDITICYLFSVYVPFNYTLETVFEGEIVF